MFNEIIIFNFCNLNEDTNFNINERLEIDKKLANDFNEKELEDIGDYYIRHSNSRNSRSSRSSDTSSRNSKGYYNLLPK